MSEAVLSFDEFFQGKKQMRQGGEIEDLLRTRFLHRPAQSGRVPFQIGFEFVPDADDERVAGMGWQRAHLSPTLANGCHTDIV